MEAVLLGVMSLIFITNSCCLVLVDLMEQAFQLLSCCFISVTSQKRKLLLCYLGSHHDIGNIIFAKRQQQWFAPLWPGNSYSGVSVWVTISPQRKQIVFEFYVVVFLDWNGQEVSVPPSLPSLSLSHTHTHTRRQRALSQAVNCKGFSVSEDSSPFWEQFFVRSLSGLELSLWHFKIISSLEMNSNQRVLCAVSDNRTFSFAVYKCLSLINLDSRRSDF